MLRLKHAVAASIISSCVFLNNVWLFIIINTSMDKDKIKNISDNEVADLLKSSTECQATFLANTSFNIFDGLRNSFA